MSRTWKINQGAIKPLFYTMIERTDKMNTFKEHVKKRTTERQLAINNDNCSIIPEYETPLTKETYEQLEDLKTFAIDKGRAVAEDFYNRYFDKDRRAIEMCFLVHDEKSDRNLEYVFECLRFDEEIKELLEVLYNIVYKRVTVFNVKVSNSFCGVHNWTFRGIAINIENASCSIFDVVNYDVVSGFQQTSRGTDFSGEFFQIPHVRYILNAFLFEALTVPMIKYWYQCEKDYSLSLSSTGDTYEAQRLLKHDAYIDDIKEWLDKYHNGEFTLTKKVEDKVVKGECAKLFVELNNTKVEYCIFYNRNKARAALIYKKRRYGQLTFSALDESDRKEIIKILYARLITDTIVFNFGVYSKQYPLYGVDWKWFLTTVGIPSDIIGLSDGNFMFEIEQNNRLLMQILEDYKVN